MWPDDYSSNVLVAVNKRYDSGIDVRNVRTSFPVGTRLHELTGNAMDPTVDPTDAIPDIITVGASQRVTISIPRNNTSGTETNRGYVVYGPACLLYTSRRRQGLFFQLGMGENILTPFMPRLARWGVRSRTAERTDVYKRQMHNLTPARSRDTTTNG